MEQPSNSIVLQEVVVIYPNLFKPKTIKGASPDATPKFNTGILLPPNFPQMAAMNQLLLNAAQSMFGPSAAEMIRNKTLKSPYRSQIEKAEQGKDGYSMEPGALYINVASERQPGVVDQQLQPILDPSKVYGGLICNVQISAYAWNHPVGGRGLSFSLQNVQLVRDGKRLGNANPDPTKVFKPLAVPQEGAVADKAVADLFR